MRNEGALIKAELSLSPRSMSSQKLILAAGLLGPFDFLGKQTIAYLEKADCLVFESDRGARRMLKEAGLQRDYLILSEHEEELTLKIVEETFKKEGAIVLYCSDQGLPNIEDPGSVLIDLAQKKGISHKVLPGPSALTVALAGCPFVLRRGFVFEGFLPQKREEREVKWRELAGENRRPLVIFETPYRLKTLINECETFVDGQKRVLLVVDIAGPAEMFILSRAAKLRSEFLKNLDYIPKLASVLILDSSF